MVCAMPIDEDPGQSIEVFDFKGDEDCSIEQMNDHQKKFVDPHFNFVATVEINVSKNIQALKDKIDYSSFKILDCKIRYSHSTQTQKDLGIWIQNQKLMRFEDNGIKEDITPIFGDQATVALLPLQMGTPNFYAFQVQTLVSQNYSILGKEE